MWVDRLMDLLFRPRRRLRQETNLLLSGLLMQKSGLIVHEGTSKLRGIPSSFRRTIKEITHSIYFVYVAASGAVIPEAGSFVLPIGGNLGCLTVLANAFPASGIYFKSAWAIVVVPVFQVHTCGPLLHCCPPPLPPNPSIYIFIPVNHGQLDPAGGCQVMFLA